MNTYVIIGNKLMAFEREYWYFSLLCPSIDILLLFINHSAQIISFGLASEHTILFLIFRLIMSIHWKNSDLQIIEHDYLRMISILHPIYPREDSLFCFLKNDSTMVNWVNHEFKIQSNSGKILRIRRKFQILNPLFKLLVKLIHLKFFHLYQSNKCFFFFIVLSTLLSYYNPFFIRRYIHCCNKIIKKSQKNLFSISCFLNYISSRYIDPSRLINELNISLTQLRNPLKIKSI